MDGEILSPAQRLRLAREASSPIDRRRSVRESAAPRPGQGSWQVRVDSSPLSDAWKAAVDLIGGECCIGVLTLTGPVRRGTVFSSGCSQSDLTFIDIEALRDWLEASVAEADPDGADLVMLDSKAVAEAANLPWLKHLSALAGGRIEVSNEGTFWMLIGWRKDVEQVDRRRLRLALRVLAQCAASHSISARRERRLQILEGMVDELAPAFILVSPIAQVFWTNYRAERLLAERSLLIRNGGNMLASSTSARTTALREAIAQTAAAPAVEGGRSDRFLLMPREDGGDDVVVLRAVNGRQMLEGNRAVLVIVPKDDMPELAGQLIGLFGLIPSEARFVSALIRSGSAQVAAARLGITEQTAKTYMKRIYAKLGISSQLELGMMIASLAPPLRSGSPAGSGQHQITNF